LILFTLLRRIKLNYTPAFVEIVKRVTECVVEASSIFPLKREDEEIKRGAQMRREKRKRKPRNSKSVLMEDKGDSNGKFSIFASKVP